MNISGEVLGEHGIGCLGVLDGIIVGTIGEYVRNIYGGDRLIFSENITIGDASGGDKEGAVRRDGVPF